MEEKKQDVLHLIHFHRKKTKLDAKVESKTLTKDCILFLINPPPIKNKDKGSLKSYCGWTLDNAHHLLFNKIYYNP